MHCFSNWLKLINHEIKTVVLNTINPINSKEWVTYWWIFHFSLKFFCVKNLWKFISQMGNPPEVYETKYKVKKIINLVLGKIWPPLDLRFLEWSYCSLVNTRSDANYNTFVHITLIWLLLVADSGTDIRHMVKKYQDVPF